MKQRYVLTAVILCFSCIVIFYIIFSGNFKQKKEVKLCPTENFFLASEDLLGDVAVSSIYTKFSNHEILGYRYIFYNKISHGGQLVMEYSDNVRATEEFNDFRIHAFNPDNLYLPTFDEVDHSVVWEVPDIEFESHADESHYACGKSNQGYACKYIGRYGRLFTSLDMDIKPVTGPTVTNFQEAITVIDQKMAKCIADYPDER